MVLGDGGEKESVMEEKGKKSKTGIGASPIPDSHG